MQIFARDLSELSLTRKLLTYKSSSDVVDVIASHHRIIKDTIVTS